MRKGDHLEPVPPGKVLGRKKANILIALANAIFKCRIQRGSAPDDILIGDRGMVIQISGQAGGGGGTGTGTVDFDNEWDPAKTYAAKVIVFFTPDGGAAGTYISLQAVAAGVSPDTGSPNWAAFPNSPPGVFA